jgi:hypothetical protein
MGGPRKGCPGLVAGGAKFGCCSVAGDVMIDPVCVAAGKAGRLAGGAGIVLVPGEAKKSSNRVLCAFVSAHNNNPLASPASKAIISLFVKSLNNWLVIRR